MAAYENGKGGLRPIAPYTHRPITPADWTATIRPHGGRDAKLPLSNRVPERLESWLSLTSYARRHCTCFRATVTLRRVVAPDGC